MLDPTTPKEPSAEVPAAEEHSADVPGGEEELDVGEDPYDTVIRHATLAHPNDDHTSQYALVPVFNVGQGVDEQRYVVTDVHFDEVNHQIVLVIGWAIDQPEGGWQPLPIG